jgi:hypothetical protein
LGSHTFLFQSYTGPEMYQRVNTQVAAVIVIVVPIATVSFARVVSDEALV